MENHECFWYPRRYVTVVREYLASDIYGIINTIYVVFSAPLAVCTVVISILWDLCSSIISNVISQNQLPPMLIPPPAPWPIPVLVLVPVFPNAP